jgi:hypothetical protein
MAEFEGNDSAERERVGKEEKRGEQDAKEVSE